MANASDQRRNDEASLRNMAAARRPYDGVAGHQQRGDGSTVGLVGGPPPPQPPGLELRRCDRKQHVSFVLGPGV